VAIEFIWAAGCLDHDWVKEYEFNDFIESTNSKVKKQNKHLKDEYPTKREAAGAGRESD
jgi:hypothetical protein